MQDSELSAVERASNARVGLLMRRLFVVLAMVVVPLASCANEKRVRAQAPRAAPVLGDALADSGPQSDGNASQLPPAVPEPWQKRPHGKPPTCGKKEHIINGACYRRAHPDDYSPPCEAPTVEYQGACFFAVRADTRPGTSIQR